MNSSGWLGLGILAASIRYVQNPYAKLTAAQVALYSNILSWQFYFRLWPVRLHVRSWEPFSVSSWFVLIFALAKRTNLPHHTRLAITFRSSKTKVRPKATTKNVLRVLRFGLRSGDRPRFEGGLGACPAPAA